MTMHASPAVRGWLHMLVRFKVSFASQLLNSLGDACVMFLLAPFVLSIYHGSPFAATIYGALQGTSAFCQYLALPFIGQLGQSKGRRVGLLYSSAGTTLACALLIPLTSQSLIGIAFVSAVVRGATAGMTTSNLGVAADTCSPGERTTFVGIMGASAWALPFILAAPLVYLLLDILPYPVMFAGATFFAIVALLILATCFKETLDPNHRAPWSWILLSPLHALAAWVTRPFINCLYCSYFCFAVCVAFAKTFVYFYGHYRFGLSYKDFIPIIFAMALMMAMFFAAAGPLCRRFGNDVVYIVGMSFGVIAAIGMGVSPNLITFVIFFFVAAPCTVCAPALLGTVSRYAGSHEQGQLQSYASGVSLLASFAADFAFGSLLTHTVEHPVRHIRAVVFWIVAFFFVMGIMLYAFAILQRKRLENAARTKQATCEMHKIGTSTSVLLPDSPADACDVQVICPDEPLTPSVAKCVAQLAFVVENGVVSVDETASPCSEAPSDAVGTPACEQRSMDAIGADTDEPTLVPCVEDVRDENTVETENIVEDSTAAEASGTVDTAQPTTDAY